MTGTICNIVVVAKRAWRHFDPCSQMPTVNERYPFEERSKANDVRVGAQPETSFSAS